jgi:demethylmenaquinone methyltransferase/2-methoxy-6-polyprenyl-1,4-benzoquinol methylase
MTPHAARDEGPDRGAGPRLGALDVDAHLDNPARKQAFVTPMFDTIAPRYDAFTRWFSFGMDAAWKAEAVRTARRARPEVDQALDVACGTGDFAFAMAAAWPQAQVEALDASGAMVRAATGRVRRASLTPRVHCAVADMMHLPLDDASIDLATAGYALRNVPDARVAVRELARVVRAGGVLVLLDFYRPRAAWWRVLFLGYLRVAGDVVGWLWHRDPVVYGYIARSIARFMSWQDMSALLDAEGFRVIDVRRHLGGGVARHVAVRSDAPVSAD